jgi:hypothetical protein
MPDDILDTWPAAQPDNWSGTVITRKQARKLFDNIPEELEDTLGADLDEQQGNADEEPSYLLIKIIPSEI